MIATLEAPRSRAAKRQWRDPLGRARILAGQLIAHDRQWRRGLVEDHLGLLDIHAAYFAARYQGLDRDDARQAGFPGLVRAAERFDPEHPSGAAFSTWAFSSIRDAIQRELPSMLGIVRLPRYPAFPRPRVSSLDDADHDAAPEPHDGGAACPVLAASAAEDRERIRSALDRLRNPRDAEVIARRFGLDGCAPANLREIGEALGGISTERVRQLEQRALAELRDLLADE